MTGSKEGNRPRAYDPAMSGAVGTSRSTPGWDLATERRIDDGLTLARAMGWFSIGLGVAEIVGGRRIARGLGMSGRASTVRLYGAREIGQGIGILRSQNPDGWMMARIAGDFLDLASLAPGLSPRNRRRERVQAAMLAIAGATAIDVLCAYQLLEQRRHRIREAAPRGGSGGRA